MGEEERKSKVILTSLGQRTKVLSFSQSLKYMLIGIAEEDFSKIPVHIDKLSKHILKNIESQEFTRFFIDLCSSCLLSLPFKSGVYGSVIALCASQVEPPHYPSFKAFLESFFEKLKRILPKGVQDHQVVELLVFLSELAHSEVIDSKLYSNFCSKAATISEKWNFIVAAGASDFAQAQLFSKDKPAAMNFIASLTTHADIAIGKGWNPFIEILSQNRGQSNIQVDISSFLQYLLSLKVKESYNLNTISFLKSNSSFLPFRRIVCAFIKNSILTVKNLRKGISLYFPSQDAHQVCYNVLFSMLLEQRPGSIPSLSLVYSIVTLQDQREEIIQQAEEPEQDKHIPVVWINYHQIVKVLNVIFQHLHLMTYSQLSLLASVFQAAANQIKSEHIWSFLAQQYLKSDVDNPDTRDLIVLSFVRMVFKKLSRSIKLEDLQAFVPSSISQLIYHPSPSIEYIYDKQQQLGWTDANIIIDAIKAKCGPEKLQYTLLKEVESSQADLTAILFSVILKLTEKSLEHFKTLYKRYEGIFSNQIQKNQPLFMTTVLKAWQHNQWKMILYTEKMISLNLILPSVVVQVCAEDFQKKAEGLEFHDIWFEQIQCALRMVRLLIEYNQKELQKYSASETEEMEVEVSKYSSFLDGYRGDLQVCVGFVKEMKEWAQANTSNKLLIEFLDSLL